MPEPCCFRYHVVTVDPQITHILHAIEEGDTKVAEELLPLVYDELRKLAATRLNKERPGQTLQATALVHEAYLRLLGPSHERWSGRGHFFAAAAEAMRRILIERARRRLAAKHGGGVSPVSIHDDVEAAVEDPQELLDVHEALLKFEQIDSDRAMLVKLRYFAGLTLEQAADAAGVSRATAARHWAFARAWLYDEITHNRRHPDKA